MKKIGIIGNPLGHSLSPQLHNAVIKKYGLNYCYEKWELKEDELSSFLHKVRESEDILGFNVTIPYKERILKELDEVDERARILGAVNTVTRIKGRLVGSNTDGPGFVKSLLSHHVTLKGAKILLLGSGGAARGIALTLAQLESKGIDIVARNGEKGSNLAKEIVAMGTPSQYIPLEELATLSLVGYQGIIQTTPVGMKNKGSQLSFPFEMLTNKHFVVDIVYNPLETEFLKKARAQGSEVIQGLEMLVYQGCLSFSQWTGLEGDPEYMLNLGRELLEVDHE